MGKKRKPRNGSRGTLCESCYHLCGGCAGTPIEQRPWVKKFTTRNLTAGVVGRYFTVHQVLECSQYRRGRKPLPAEAVVTRAREPRYRNALGWGKRR